MPRDRRFAQAHHPAIHDRKARRLSRDLSALHIKDPSGGCEQFRIIASSWPLGENHNDFGTTRATRPGIAPRKRSTLLVRPRTPIRAILAVERRRLSAGRLGTAARVEICVVRDLGQNGHSQDQSNAKQPGRLSIGRLCGGRGLSQPQRRGGPH